MKSPDLYSRREALALMGTAGTLGAMGRSAAIAQTPAGGSVVERAVQRNDAAVRTLLGTQITDGASPWLGSVPDQVGLHTAGSAASVAETLAASFVHPQSTFHDDGYSNATSRSRPHLSRRVPVGLSHRCAPGRGQQH